MKKVSVIVPTFNSANYLQDCLASLFFQEYRNVEVIVIDDASTDNTRSVVQRYRLKFGDKLKYFRNTYRIGRGAVRNYGIEKAQGQYIAFLDADDIYLPGKISAQANCLDYNTRVDAISCWYYVGDENLENLKNVVIKKGPYSILFGQNYSDVVGLPGALMIRKKAFLKTGLFDGKIKRGQDTEFMLRLLYNCKVDTINRPLFIYRHHQENTFSYRAVEERKSSNIVIYYKLLNYHYKTPEQKKKKFGVFIIRNHLELAYNISFFYAIELFIFYLKRLKNKVNFMDWILLGLRIFVQGGIVRVFKDMKKNDK